MKTLSFIFYLFIALAISACAQKKIVYKSPKGYDLNKPQKFNMPDELFEISGISFNNGNPDTIFAIQDEAGKIYHWKLGDQHIPHAKFGKAGDYEDLTILNGTAIVLRSDGVLFSFPLTEINNKDIEHVSEWKDLLPDGEYEGIYGDAGTGKVYVLCKGCSADKKTDRVSGVILQLTPEGQLQQSGNFSFSVKEIQMESSKKDQRFRPSAITRNPLTGQWYILSSINKMLVVADEAWNIKETYMLKPSLYIQPEGILFDKTGNLYISSEGDRLAEGNVMKFPYKEN